jgi:hypothetical protein
VKVGDFVSFDIYRPSARIFLTTYKGVVIKEDLGHKFGPLYNILSTKGDVYENIEKAHIRLLRSS